MYYINKNYINRHIYVCYMCFTQRILYENTVDIVHDVYMRS